MSGEPTFPPAAIPLATAIGVFGISFGVLATNARIPGWETVLSSVTVFAGSAQFALVSVLATGGSAAAGAVSGVLLNLRYLAIGTAAARVLPGGRFRRSALAQLVIDESFALGVAAGTAAEPDASTMIRAGVLMYAAWVGGTAMGALIGPVLGDPTTLGLDAAFPALFLALLWPMLRGKGAIGPAIGGAAVALALAPFTPAGVPIAGAAVAGFALSR